MSYLSRRMREERRWSTPRVGIRVRVTVDTSAFDAACAQLDAALTQIARPLDPEA